MKTEEKKLPKPSVEIVNEYDLLCKMLYEHEPPCTGEELTDAIERILYLEEQYDWFNYEYTDPVTGKKGLKTVSGEVIAPAQYDGFNEYHDYTFAPNHPVVAIMDGKCGIVKGDGSGKLLCDFKFDHIHSHPFCSLFLARWDGEKERFGIISPNGTILCPNILTGVSDVCNGIMTIESGEKCGVINICNGKCALPEYDELEIDAEDYVTFIKGNQRGYVLEETGEFVPVELYENDERYTDVPVFATWLP